jgi:hypothetical protein
VEGKKKKRARINPPPSHRDRRDPVRESSQTGWARSQEEEKASRHGGAPQRTTTETVSHRVKKGNASMTGSVVDKLDFLLRDFRTGPLLKDLEVGSYEQPAKQRGQLTPG